MQVLPNFIDNEFVESRSSEKIPFYNPAFATIIGHVPVSTEEEVERAVASGVRAFDKFSRSPPTERVAYLLKIRSLLERDTDVLARALVENHGRTYAEAVGEVRRSIENIEAAAAIAYTLAKGEKMLNIAPDIDQELIREPLGCFAVITPFNIPLHAWSSYIPYAIALGCTVVLKPSEVTPLVTYEIARIVKEAGVPPGVMSIIHGDGRVAERLVNHPDIQGVGFIGSTKTGKYLYEMAAKQNKRASINAGAKNHIVVMPDAEPSKTAEAVASSFFGMSGQRCLAGATIVEGLQPDSPLAREEIFGPVASVLYASSLDEAVDLINKNTPYGNAASIFTSNPRTAREFCMRVNVGNVGVNIGVPQPIAYFPLGGRKNSFFGHAHSRFDTVRFFTDHKIVTTRWW
jgi:malonate-semialdehyde dehydrogenase (acetylating)/methylmalonate-semialdehyde dehydrogenase